jgi:hypothetical protein
MLKLRFAEPHTRAPQPPDPASPDLHVWSDPEGGVVALGFRHAGSSWMEWPSLATYRLHQDEDCITAYLKQGAAVDVVWDTYRRSVLPLAFHAHGWEALHASAIVSSRGLVVFAAVAGTGKSTLAFGLRTRGFPQWADDAVVFKVGPEGAMALPLPFSARIRAGSEHVLRTTAPPRRPLDGNEPGEQVHFDPLPIAAVCMLTRAEEIAAPESPTLTRVAPALAFRELLAHALELDPLDQPRRTKMLEAYLNVAALVPVWQVRFAPVPDRFALLLDTIVGRLGLDLPQARALA